LGYSLHINHPASPHRFTIQSVIPMWTYILGPFLALLPKPWRDALFFEKHTNAARATALSGLGESAAAIVAIGYWYMYAMARYVDRGVDMATSGKVGPVSDQALAGVALSLWLAHPFTWLLAYFILEGAVRLCSAAFSEMIVGTLPLFLFDKILLNPFRTSTRNHDKESGLRSNTSSLSDAIRERLMVARTDQVPDELSFHKSGADDLLEICACRRKDDWNPPRVVRFQENYYRLEGASVGSGPRPFRYALRRLSAGVPGRSVLLYSPTNALIRR
jgi:hypothetical protein